MDHTDASSLPAPKLFNDVYFGQQPPPVHETWSQFSRLPVDLRLQIWLVFLRQHRMIEVTICPDENEDDTASPGSTGADGPYYTNRNHLGSIISGRGYTLKIPGRGYAATFSPLLWVNRESRDAALRHYYRVHLPYPSEHGGQLLYLNPDYDVLRPAPEFRRAMPPLVDFLHDVKAFDPKHRGYVNQSNQAQSSLLIISFSGLCLLHATTGSSISRWTTNTSRTLMASPTTLCLNSPQAYCTP
jgi:hypothetical protein